MDDAILNIASGKIKPIGLVNLASYFLVNVDTMYYEKTDPEEVEAEWNNWSRAYSKSFNINEDIFKFLERTSMLFDQICIYRFLEHVPMDKVLYFIYLLSTVTKAGSKVDVIVPDYEILAHMILSEEHNIANDVLDFESSNILLTTELLNEPSCPHASVWTEWRAHHFFNLEKRWGKWL